MVEEAHFRMSLLSHSYPEVQEYLPEQSEESKRREENAEIIEMHRSMKKDMEERKHKWERQQQIREQILKAAARRKE